MSVAATQMPDFDPGGAEFQIDPFGSYRRYQEAAPVHRNATGPWFISRYSDVARVLSDGECFIKDAPVALKQFRAGPFREHNRNNMNIMDPPDHGRVRGTVARYFTPRALDALGPKICQFADELLDNATSDGDQFDLMLDFAYPLPLYVICAMMGLETTERVSFKRWSHAIVTALEPGASEAATASADAAVEEFATYLGDLADSRRADPGDDLLSVLVAESGGGRLSRDELIHNAAFLLNAGHETTTNLIGNGMKALFDHPESLARLRVNPDLIGGAVEEMLRFDPPLHFSFRRTAKPVTLSGTDIPAGQTVMAGIAAAGRDPAVFADPDRFDIERDARRHLAFSPGPHFCLGAALARLEGATAIGRLLTRFRSIEPDGPAMRNKGIIFQGYRRHPVRVRQ